MSEILLIEALEIHSPCFLLRQGYGGHAARLQEWDGGFAAGLWKSSVLQENLNP